jgi:hypothetical protein
MEEKETKTNFPIHELTVESKAKNQIKTMTPETIRLENKKLSETRCEHDKVWSMLANQVIGSEQIRR